MSRLDIKSPSRAQTVVDNLYRDVERRIAASPPGLCPVDMSLAFLHLCHAQSCGKCVPCRIGLGQLSKLIETVLDGSADLSTIDIIEKTARTVVNTADCAIGRDAARLVLDRRALLGVDWGLLVTFAAFFTFSGNMARMEPVRTLFRQLLAHGAMPVAALTSQVISNVPAAILLSQFTDDYPALLVGVNIGGAGTLVASLASLITFREYTKHVKGQTGRFLALFSAVSFGFLAVLLAAMTFLTQ